MRFVHTADIHLGITPDRGMPWSESRADEIYDSFYQLLDYVERESVDLLLIAGDLFHRQPLKRELKELNYRLESLSHTKVVMMAGNHDSVQPQSYYRSFVWSDNVSFFRRQSLEYVYLQELNTIVYGLSYEQQEIIDHLYDKARPLRHFPDGKPVPENCRHILLAHGGDEKHIPMDKNVLKQAGFDYIALGHIHKPGILVENLMAYSGSLEPTDKNDIGVRGFIEGTITDNGVHFEFVPHSVRSYIELNVNVDNELTNQALLDRLEETILNRGSKNIFKVVLSGFRDADIEFIPEDIRKLGNVVSVQDQTVPDFDFQKIYEDNKDNIIGQFILKVSNMNVDDDTKGRALCYGLKSLYGIKR